MGYLNCDEACDFRQTIADPIVRYMCTKAYEKLLMTKEHFDGDFDILFYTKLVYDLVIEKETLIKELSGQYVGGVFEEG